MIWKRGRFWMLFIALLALNDAYVFGGSSDPFVKGGVRRQVTAGSAPFIPGSSLSYPGTQGVAQSLPLQFGQAPSSQTSAGSAPSSPSSSLAFLRTQSAIPSRPAQASSVQASSVAVPASGVAPQPISSISSVKPLQTQLLHGAQQDAMLTGTSGIPKPVTSVQDASMWYAPVSQSSSFWTSSQGQSAASQFTNGLPVPSQAQTPAVQLHYPIQTGQVNPQIGTSGAGFLVQGVRQGPYSSGQPGDYRARLFTRQGDQLVMINLPQTGPSLAAPTWQTSSSYAPGVGAPGVGAPSGQYVTSTGSLSGFQSQGTGVTFSSQKPVSDVAYSLYALPSQSATTWQASGSLYPGVGAPSGQYVASPQLSSVPQVTSSGPSPSLGATTWQASSSLYPGVAAPQQSSMPQVTSSGPAPSLGATTWQASSTLHPGVAAPQQSSMPQVTSSGPAPSLGATTWQASSTLHPGVAAPQQSSMPQVTSSGPAPSLGATTWQTSSSFYPGVAAPQQTSVVQVPSGSASSGFASQGAGVTFPGQRPAGYAFNPLYSMPSLGATTWQASGSLYPSVGAPSGQYVASPQQPSVPQVTSSRSAGLLWQGGVAPSAPKPISGVAPSSQRPVSSVAPIAPKPVGGVPPSIQRPVGGLAPVAPKPIAGIAPKPVGVAPIAPKPIAGIAPKPVGLAPIAPKPVAGIAPKPISGLAPIAPKPIAGVAPIAPKPIAGVAPQSISGVAPIAPKPASDVTLQGRPLYTVPSVGTPSWQSWSSYHSGVGVPTGQYVAPAGVQVVSSGSPLPGFPSQGASVTFSSQRPASGAAQWSHPLYALPSLAGVGAPGGQLVASPQQVSVVSGGSSPSLAATSWQTSSGFYPGAAAAPQLSLGAQGQSSGSLGATSWQTSSGSYPAVAAAPQQSSVAQAPASGSLGGASWQSSSGLYPTASQLSVGAQGQSSGSLGATWQTSSGSYPVVAGPQQSYAAQMTTSGSGFPSQGASLTTISQKPASGVSTLTVGAPSAQYVSTLQGSSSAQVTSSGSSVPSLYSSSPSESSAFYMFTGDVNPLNDPSYQHVFHGISDLDDGLSWK